MMLNVTFPKFRSYPIPYPARMLVLPSPLTSHAKPRRGPKLPQLGFQSCPLGLLGAGNTFPVAMYFARSESAKSTPGAYQFASRFAFLLCWTPKYSQRTPRFSVNVG